VKLLFFIIALLFAAALITLALNGCGKQAFEVTESKSAQSAPGSYFIPPRVDVILAEDNTVRWPATENRDSILYPPILKAAYLAAKAVSPNTLVVTSSLWGSPEGYLEDLYTMGAGGYFDVVNFHYYPGKTSPAVNYTWWISHLRKVMEKYGDGSKPIWLTEFAWTTTDENRIDGAAIRQAQT